VTTTEPAEFPVVEKNPLNDSFEESNNSTLSATALLPIERSKELKPVLCSIPLGNNKPCFYDQSAYSYTEKFVNQIIAEGKSFTDKIFPANYSSLVQPGDTEPIIRDFKAKMQ